MNRIDLSQYAHVWIHPQHLIVPNEQSDREPYSDYSWDDMKDFVKYTKVVYGIPEITIGNNQCVTVKGHRWATVAKEFVEDRLLYCWILRQTIEGVSIESYGLSPVTTSDLVRIGNERDRWLLICFEVATDIRAQCTIEQHIVGYCSFEGISWPQKDGCLIRLASSDYGFRGSHKYFNMLKAISVSRAIRSVNGASWAFLQRVSPRGMLFNL